MLTKTRRVENEAGGSGGSATKMGPCCHVDGMKSGR